MLADERHSVCDGDAMFWTIFYIGLAVSLSAWCLIITRDESGRSPVREGWLALITGTLWPVLLIGLVQLGMLVALRLMLQPKSGFRPSRYMV